MARVGHGTSAGDGTADRAAAAKRTGACVIYLENERPQYAYRHSPTPVSAAGQFNAVGMNEWHVLRRANRSYSRLVDAGSPNVDAVDKARLHRLRHKQLQRVRHSF